MTTITLRISVTVPDDAGEALKWWNDMHDEARTDAGLTAHLLAREGRKSAEQFVRRVVKLYRFHLLVQKKKGEAA